MQNIKIYIFKQNTFLAVYINEHMLFYLQYNVQSPIKNKLII